MKDNKPPKLYVPPTADDRLKKVIEGQQGVANTVYDLEQLLKGGPNTIAALKKIAKQHIEALRKIPHEGRTITTFKELNAFGKEMEASYMAKLQQAESSGDMGQAKLKMTTKADLLRLSKMKPEEIAAEINQSRLAAISQSPFEKEEEPPEEKKEFGALPQDEFDNDVMDDHLSDMVNFIVQCKLQYRNLQLPWMKIVHSEQRLQRKAEVFEDMKEMAIRFLLYVLSEDYDENEKITAAQILSSIDIEKVWALHALLDYWNENEEASPIIVRGLKYGLNPDIPDHLLGRLHMDKESIRPFYIEAMIYKRARVRLNQPLEKYEPNFQAGALKAKILRNEAIDFSGFHHLLEDPKTPYFENAVMAGLLSGDEFVLNRCREVCRETYNESGNIPLLLAISGDHEDLPILEQCFGQEFPSPVGIQALGLYGCPFVIPKLIELLKDDNSEPVKLPKLLKIKDAAIEALELITGAGLKKPAPEVVLGEKIEEGDVKIFSHLYEPWFKWWEENRKSFEQHARWRRGVPYTLQSCVDEMDNPMGNYWSRQHSYYELMFRYGEKLPFEADEYVNRQKEMIAAWQKWASEHVNTFSGFPWLFNRTRIK